MTLAKSGTTPFANTFRLTEESAQGSTSSIVVNHSRQMTNYDELLGNLGNYKT